MSELRTKFFRGFDPTLPSNSSFAEDIQHLMSMDVTTLHGCIDVLARVAVAGSAAAAREIADDFLKAHPQVGVMRAIRCLEFLSRVGRTEKAEEIASDIQVIAPSAADQKDKLLGVIVRLREVLSHELPKRRALIGAGPTFESIFTTVDIRAVQNSRFEFGHDLAAYSPTVDDVVGIISVRISRDLGDDLFFQATKQQVDEIVTHLQATLKDLDALVARCAIVPPGH